MMQTLIMLLILNRNRRRASFCSASLEDALKLWYWRNPWETCSGRCSRFTVWLSTESCMRTCLVLVLVVLSFVTACPAENPDECAFPVSQAESQPCCPSLGKDACGAGLFCEAFDGRTQHTCYQDNSRVGAEECREDGHCASNECEPQTERCLSMPAESCQTDPGCVSPVSGDRYHCAPENQRCEVTRGREGDPCDRAESCVADSAECVNGSCSCPDVQ